MKITADAGNSFFNLYSDPDAHVLAVKRICVISIIEAFRASGLTQAQFAVLIGAHQPRVSVLMQGSLEGFSIDWLIGAMRKAGVDFTFSAEIPDKKEG